MDSDTAELEATPSSRRTPAAAPSGPKLMSEEDRAARMDRVWKKHLDGKTITLEEFIARRRGR